MGTVTRQEYRNPGCGFLHTLVTLKVRGVLKPHPALKGREKIIIQLWGGAVRDGDAIVADVAEPFTTLYTGDDYILFLTGGSGLDRVPMPVWLPWLGPYSTIGIVDQGRSLWPWNRFYAVGRAAEGRSLAEFTSEVQQYLQPSH
jgi:hypothetical protein